MLRLAGFRQLVTGSAVTGLPQPAISPSQDPRKPGCAGDRHALTSCGVYSGAVSAVEQALKAAGAAGEIRMFPEPVPTAAVTAATLNCEVGAIANSLVFEADGDALLVLASGAHRVHTGRLARRLGTGKIRQADPGFVLAHTGQAVGGVAPVGHPRPLRTVVDLSLIHISEPTRP